MRVRANNASGGGGGTPAHTETVTLASAGTANINCGFQPKHIAVIADYSSTSGFKGLAIWDEENGTAFLNTNSSASLNWRTLPGDGGINLTISDTGFSFPNPRTATTKFHVFAIG